MSTDSVAQNEGLRNAVLTWYDANARKLPWRVGPAERRLGVRPDPYRVWLSEIMLQQTTTAHAAPYFRAFTGRWPTVQDLAGAQDEDVMSAWAGLGYYARARNLLACARAVAAQGGMFPKEEAALRRLPGVGAYTAAAIAAIAFEEPAAVVDGNIERVASRLMALRSLGPEAKRAVGDWALAHRSPQRPGDFAQALMDLGAGVCTPRQPQCRLCPIAAFCVAQREGSPEVYPLKPARVEKPRRFGAVFVLSNDGAVALQTRPQRGLLGGMLAPPTTDWGSEPQSAAGWMRLAPEPGTWSERRPIVHVFTHFTLELRVFETLTPSRSGDYRWTSLEAAVSCVPSVFRKALTASAGPYLNDDTILDDI